MDDRVKSFNWHLIMIRKPKHIIIIIILRLFSLNHTFAQNTGLECLQDREQANIFVELILRLLTWFWIIPATLAGKLMSNSILYGEFINIDKILYVLRNMSRTFANFLAAGMILWEVIQWIVGENDGTAIMKKVLRVGAGIIIANMSRFLTGAVVDISTILTSTVSALPGTYFSADTASRNMILTQDGKNKLQKRITLDLTTKFCDGGKVTDSSEIIWWINKNESETLDIFMPKNESIAWPLLYIWSSVLKVQDFIVTNNTNSSGVDYFMIIIIRLFMIAIFFIALITLLVINVIRIVALWFFIIFSPLIILYSITKETMQLPEGALQDFSITNILKLIFAPVVITWLLSIALIVIVLMQQVLQSNNSYIDFTDGVYISTLQDKNSRIWVNGIFQTDIQWELLSVKENVANTFSDLIMWGMTLAILRGIILAMQSYIKGGIAWETLSKIADVGKYAMSNLPIIPIWWKGVWLWTARKSTFWDWWFTDQIKNKFQLKWQDKVAATDNKIRELFNLSTRLLPSDYKWLTDYSKKLSTSSRSIWTEDIDQFIKEYEPIKTHYQQPANRNNGLSGMDWISSTLPVLIKKIIESKNDTLKKTYYWLQLDKRTDQDTIISYINRNYKISNGNKQLFKDLYKKLGWDENKLENKWIDKVWDMFWTEKMQRSSIS